MNPGSMIGIHRQSTAALPAHFQRKIRVDHSFCTHQKLDTVGRLCIDLAKSFVNLLCIDSAAAETFQRFNQRIKSGLVKVSPGYDRHTFHTKIIVYTF
jgi:hypothetical protein